MRLRAVEAEAEVAVEVVVASFRRRRQDSFLRQRAEEADRQCRPSLRCHARR